MCQLLGMNCNTPTDIAFSFEGFRRRGGQTDSHTDGFGIGFFEDKGVRLLQDNRPCALSPVAELVRQNRVKSKNVVSHIRKATQGQTSLANTHPFLRELWGEYWLFAHNGHLRGFDPGPGSCFNPVGTTDSEQAFCYILETLHRRFFQKPSREALFSAVAELAAELRAYGIFNFILSNGEWMMAHASTLLYYIIRQAPFGEARLLDDDLAVDFSQETTENDRVAVIVTLPLTGNEHWQQLAVNELALFEDGMVVLRDRPDAFRFMGREEGLALARAAGVSA